MTSLGVIGIDGGDLSKAIRELTEAVRYQGDSINTLMDAAGKEAEQIQTGGIPTVSFLHGFKTGDEVVMLTPGGPQFGKVDPVYRSANHEKNLPIRRANGSTDAWPVRYVLLVDDNTRALIEKIAPKPVFGLGTPPIGTDRDAWNRAAAEIAEERGLAVTFDYVKPDSWGRAVTRRVLVQKFEAVSDSPRMQSIGGVDLEIPETPGASRYRTFRLDRIAGTIRVEDSE